MTGLLIEDALKSSVVGYNGNQVGAVDYTIATASSLPNIGPVISLSVYVNDKIVKQPQLRKREILKANMKGIVNRKKNAQ